METDALAIEKSLPSMRRQYMTWDSSEDERVLTGHEAVLIREAISRLVDELESELEWNEEGLITGAPIFDKLTTDEKIGVLRSVAEHLLLPTPETLGLTAVSESTVWAIYKIIEQQIEIEIDFEKEDEDLELPSWRTLTWNAWIEGAEGDLHCDDDEDDESYFPEDQNCTDVEKWRSVVDCLADRILWDRDFEMIDDFMDANPEVAQLKKLVLGIDEEYYTAVAPEVPSGKLTDSIAAIRQLVRQKPR